MAKKILKIVAVLMLVSLAPVEAKVNQSPPSQKTTPKASIEKNVSNCSACVCKCTEEKDLYGCFSYLFQGPYGASGANLPNYIVEVGTLTSSGDGNLTATGLATVDGVGPAIETLWECTYDMDCSGRFSTCCQLSWDGCAVASNLIWEGNLSENGNYLRYIAVPDSSRQDDFAEVQMAGNASRQ